MFLIVQDVLSEADVGKAREALAHADFADGRATAGWHARLVKANEQVRRNDKTVEDIRKSIAEKLLQNSVFQIWARPKTVTPLILSRYKPGMAYGSHVDDALMQGLRTDVSFTVFLSDPESYDGGALIIETTAGEEDVKLRRRVPGRLSLQHPPSCAGGDARRAARRGRLGAVLRPRPGAPRAALRPRDRPAAALRGERQDARFRPRVQIFDQPASDVGRRLTSPSLSPEHPFAC